MKKTRICANCGAEHAIEDMFEVEGDWLCEDCADRLTVICDHCAGRVYEENVVEDDTHTLCEHCFDESNIMFAVMIAAGLSTVTARTGTMTTTPTARPAGMSTARLFTNTATRQTLFCMARACGISALSSKLMTAARSTATRKNC